MFASLGRSPVSAAPQHRNEFRYLCSERERYIQAFGATFAGRYANVAFYITDQINLLLDRYLAATA